MAKMFLYRVRGYVRVKPNVGDKMEHAELHGTEKAWCYADMLDILPALMRVITDADRPISKIEIECIDTYDENRLPDRKEVDPRD